MEFTPSRPDIIRSDNQRWLLAHWNGLRGAGPIPAWQAIQPDALAAPTDTLSVLDVTSVNGSPRYLISFQGTRISELYSGMNCAGRFLDEILPSSLTSRTLATYDHVVAYRLPVYTISDMRDRLGRIVHYERLLLPFGRDDVEHILASLETVSPEGAFENAGLMRVKPPAFALCTTIHC